MRNADVFSLSVAALIGLYTLTLQPWSLAWWACVAIAATIALVTGARVIWERWHGGVQQ